VQYKKLLGHDRRRNTVIEWRLDASARTNSFGDDDERLSIDVMSASKLFQRAGPNTGNALALTVEDELADK